MFRVLGVNSHIHYFVNLGVKAENSTKVVTPYGLRLTWKLPSTTRGKQGMDLTVHLKDNIKVRLQITEELATN